VPAATIAAVFLDIFLTLLATAQGAAAYGMAAFLLFASGSGAPISQDVLLLASAEVGRLQPVPLAALAWVAVLAADALGMFVGHRYGSRWIRMRWAAHFVPPQRLPAIEAFVHRHGFLLAFVTRFLPGQRATLYFAYGTLRLPYRTFFLADGLAALIQVPLFLWGASQLGWQWQALRPRFDRADDLLTGALALLVLVALWRRGPGDSRKP
jgi:membrane protein DedA with SNARE-associated domain